VASLAEAIGQFHVRKDEAERLLDNDDAFGLVVFRQDDAFEEQPMAGIVDSEHNQTVHALGFVVVASFVEVACWDVPF
jgi:hypothetical protein